MLPRKGRAETAQLEPDISAEWFASSNAFFHPSVIAHFLKSPGKSGLPVCATAEQLAEFPDMERLEQCEAERASG